MTLELYFAFVAATALLIATPGPMAAYIVGATLSRGLRHGLAAVAGSLIASAAHISIVAFGLAAIIARSGEAFFWIKWLGAAYLFYLGLRAWRSRENLEEPSLAAAPLRRSLLEGLFVNLTNPKGLLFHGAFLPLFISPSLPPGPQFLILGTTFLVIGGVLDSCWALTAARSRRAFARAGQWRNRVTGGVYLTAAAALAAIRK